jgi:thymidylate synthase (FAD)
MENKITIFRDNQGHVELVGAVGDDLSVSSSPSLGHSATELTEENKNKIAHLVEQDQTNSLEHCNLMFKVRAPIFAAREHMGTSGWHCIENNKYYADANTKFYEPGAYREQHQHGFEEHIINPVLQDKVRLGRFRVYRATRALSIFHESALRLYKHMREAGICKEQAMASLPQSVYIEYYASANLREVLRFTNLADDHKALPELRLIASAILKIVSNTFPVTANKWRDSTKKRQSNVAQRLAKLSQLVDISERLHAEQTVKIKKVRTYLENKEEKSGENIISEGEQGAGSPQDPKENRRKARWRFWQKNKRSG